MSVITIIFVSLILLVMKILNPNVFAWYLVLSPLAVGLIIIGMVYVIVKSAPEDNHNER